MAETCAEAPGHPVQEVLARQGVEYRSTAQPQLLELVHDALVAAVPNEMVAAEVYTASLLAIDLDTEAEIAYLRRLAQALGLDGTTVARLHQITGATRV